MAIRLMCSLACTALFLGDGLFLRQVVCADNALVRGRVMLPTVVSATAADDRPVKVKDAAFTAAKLKWEVSVPSPNPESMLQRFVEECVQISKGSLKVSRSKIDAILPDKIVVHRDYRICRFETTQELYRLVMGVNPSRWTGPRNSVERVSYFDAVQFCKKLTDILRDRDLITEAQTVRLPSDAEWEYACRAKTTTKYCFGDSATGASQDASIDDYAWHSGNAAGNDPSVGKLKPNRWMLADVHGYLWEFTQATSGDIEGRSSRVRIWGGSWRASSLDCGSSSIRQVSSTEKAADLGFRCVIQ
ncbi:MAG: formylglycine-generating enzyme family protein [Fuerstiella sp.]